MSLKAVFGIGLLSLGLHSCAQQSEECRVYLSCQRDFDERFNQSPTDLARFEENGICWQHPKTANDCDALCVSQITALKIASDDAGESIPSCRLP